MRQPVSNASPLRRLAAAAALVLGFAPLLASAAAIAKPGTPAVQALDALPSAKARDSLLLDIARAGQRWVAVGDRGHVLWSDDQGRTWTQAKVPTRQLLTAVSFVDERHGWAVGHDAQVLVSDDGGMSWQLQFQDPSREAPLLDVWFGDSHHGIAVGAYGLMLETQDGGLHWQDIGDRLDNPDQLHLNAITAVPGAGLVVVGEQGSLFRSADAGQTWQRLASPYDGSLFGAVATGTPRGVLVFGLRGTLLRSDDFGDTWQRVEVQSLRGPFEAGLAGGASGAGELVLVGNAGSVLRSRDGGRAFLLGSRADRTALSAVAIREDGSLILVGQNGIHLATADGQEVTP